ncbi:glucose 1-dehydrogenase [Cytophagaceae bacterium ABcell3]|nr:glucose 1-dehydrogenase [Cytophagaceae bacterium ABcell3]
MKAVAVNPGKEGSLHMREISKPAVENIPNGKGVLVKILKVALDGTDKDITKGKYGTSPKEDDFLVIGHEALGVVEDTGYNVDDLKKGDYVVPIVRRPGSSFYDKIDLYDMTTDKTFYERGISKRHGFLTEYFVEEPDYLVRVPENYGKLSVLLEPASIIEKGYEQMMEAQRRMKIWRPQKAIVMGLGPLGLLAAWKLRLEGIEVLGFDRKEKPFKRALLEEIGGKYYASEDTPLSEVCKKEGYADIVIEATGVPNVLVEAAQAVATNGVLMLTSITPGNEKQEVPLSTINMEFVLGNKLMFGTVNSNREHFEMAKKDIGYSKDKFPGWLEKIITHEFSSIEKYEEAMDILMNASQKQAIKVILDNNSN